MQEPFEQQKKKKFATPDGANHQSPREHVSVFATSRGQMDISIPLQRWRRDRDW